MCECSCLCGLKAIHIYYKIYMSATFCSDYPVKSWILFMAHCFDGATLHEHWGGAVVHAGCLLCVHLVDTYGNCNQTKILQGALEGTLTLAPTALPRLMAFLSLCCPPEDGESIELAPGWGLTDAGDRRAEGWAALEVWGLCCWATEFSNILWSTVEGKTVIKTLMLELTKTCKDPSHNTGERFTLTCNADGKHKGTVHQELHWICKVIRAAPPKINRNGAVTG